MPRFDSVCRYLAHLVIPNGVKAAKKGDAKGQFNLGMAYLDGEVVRQSNRSARICFDKALK